MTKKEQNSRIIDVCWHWTFCIDQHLKAVQRAISDGYDDAQAIMLLSDAVENLDIACKWLPKRKPNDEWEDHDL